ncbi:hypothetical protein P43SY_004067 [Pythium insidiosum]|uniref:Uncharacterized protein n=1 Tax=Pythium insidiosum TaxID=114742 RepID=A0AAD5Q7C6_PYTIN|nr:hypothetical protein P43SY_004067 [Pythium insidiosum]
MTLRTPHRTSDLPALDDAALGADLAEDLVDREPGLEELATTEDTRCQYTSRKCQRKRAIKPRGGELHKLCSFHRAKAILNQRRLEIRKRARHQERHQRVQAPIAPVADRKGNRRVARPRRKRTNSAPSVESLRSLQPLPLVRGGSLDQSESLKKVRAYSAPTLLVEPMAADSSSINVCLLEPFLSPAELCPEDIEALHGLVDMDLNDAERLIIDL